MEPIISEYLQAWRAMRLIRHISFDQAGAFPLVANAPLFAYDGELSFAIEMDAEGNPNWRNMWLNELAKLQHVTAAQEKNGQNEDWYRIMVTRVRGAFIPADPQQMGMDTVDGGTATGEGDE